MSPKIALAQIKVASGDPTANLAQAAYAIQSAAEQNANIIVLPECLDCGWTSPSARNLAHPVPGPITDQIASLAKTHNLYIAVGLAERAKNVLYNAAVLIDPNGRIVLHHRKINELDIAQDLYKIGNRLAIAQTDFGPIALAVCADLFPKTHCIGDVLARMGARLILSPAAWAVDAEHTGSDGYGDLWLESYANLAQKYDITTIGVSGVGQMTDGPWAGRKLIGSSLAIGSNAEILAKGPYGIDAEQLLFVQPTLANNHWYGTQVDENLHKRGFTTS